MKRLLFLALTTCLFFTFPIVNGQKILLLENKAKNKTIAINQNKRISIKTVAGNRISGKFIILNDSIINLKKANIRLSDIASVKKANLVPELIGTGLIVFGFSMISTDLILTLFMHEIVYAYSIMSIPLLSGGMAITLIPIKTKKLGWAFNIVEI